MTTRPSGVRPLERDDLPAVVELHESVLRPGHPRPERTVAEQFARLFLDQPWFDPELPSLVQEIDGEIVGFLGSNARRMRLDGRPVRVACSSNLVTRADVRTRGVGAVLTRTYMRGPQDLTMADCANETMRRLWTGLRGRTLTHGGIGWNVVFRPAAFAAAMGLTGGGRLRPAVRAAGAAFDAVVGRVPAAARRVVPPGDDLVDEVLEPDELVQLLVAAARRLRLHPDYDTGYLTWLFRELELVDPRGRLVRRVVRSPAGRTVGWYVYVLPHGGLAQVLTLHAVSGDAPALFDHLLHDAFTRGAVGVQGRVEPALEPVLAARRALLWPSVAVLVDCPDPALLALLGGPESLLSRLDGEWWIGHHLWRDAP